MQKKIIIASILACGLIVSACGKTEEEKQAAARAERAAKAEKVVKAGDFEEALDAAVKADDIELFEALMDAHEAQGKAPKN